VILPRVLEYHPVIETGGLPADKPAGVKYTSNPSGRLVGRYQLVVHVL
jgi:hypothetical protein